MADRFEDLRNFVAVAEAGGVNAAATRLGIAKSAVSRRLAEFEQRLGLALADRSGRRFSLTSVGTEVLADAQRLLSDLERLETRTVVRHRETPLVVGADRDMLEIVARAAAELARVDPIFEFEISETGADAEIGFSMSNSPEGATTLLGRVSRGVYAAGGSDFEARTPADLRGMPAVSIVTAGPREWWFDGVEAAPRIVARVPDLSTGLAAASAGLGVVRAPSFLALGKTSDGVLRELFRPRKPDLSITLSKSSSAPSDARTHRLVEAVKAAIGDA